MLARSMRSGEQAQKRTRREVDVGDCAEQRRQHKAVDIDIAIFDINRAATETPA